MIGIISSSLINLPTVTENQLTDFKSLTEIASVSNPAPSTAPKIVRLITTTREGKQYRIDFDTESKDWQMAQDSPSITIEEVLNVVEITADEQEYLDQNRVINAKGNVTIRFANGVLTADEVQVNLKTRIAVATGDVTLERGEQILKGEKFEYYFVQNQGVITQARGVINQDTLAQDIDFDLEGEGAVGFRPQPQANQPTRQVRSIDGINFVLGSTDDISVLQRRLGTPFMESGGKVTKLRFEADRVEFDGENWTAKGISVTNDPFSPPDIEVRADSARLENIAPQRDKLTTTNSRVVFEQGLTAPLFFNELIFSPRRRRPALFSFGFDGEDLGGLYFERDFNLYDDNNIVLSITPQFLIQRAFLPDSIRDQNIPNPDDNGGILNPSSYGLVVKLDWAFDERTELISTVNLTGLDLNNIGNRLRGNGTIERKIGNLNNPYTLTGSFSSRERLFNGSFGFQTVEQSIGAVITSPLIRLGEGRYSFTYQGGIQNITAETDRPALFNNNNQNRLTNLTRSQVAGIINGSIPLWEGKALPPTPELGLKYTPAPLTPFLNFTTGLTAIASHYSSSDLQTSIIGTVGLQGQIGNFSRKSFDYTGFNMSYSQGFGDGNSPFLFDRFADNRVLTMGLSQQIYGPVRGGVQTYLNLDSGETISTDYILEYSRRSYGVLLRYNPILEIGSVNFRLSNFNWSGDTQPFQPES